MTREHNWSDNHSFTAARIHRPASIDAVRRLVAASPHIHAIGARHSFNGSADSPGDLVDLRDIDPDIVIDPQQHTVTVGAAATYATLAAHLQSQGWALHNMASLPHVSIAGATATGTHGSGDTNACLSAAVRAFELVTATGDLLQKHRGDSGFDGMVVGLGAFGILTRITLDIEPSFDIRQDAFENLPWAAALSDLGAIMSAAYSVSLFTTWSGPTIDRLWLKTRLTPGTTPEITASHLGATPAAHAIGSGDGAPLSHLTPFGTPGPWSERMPHFRPSAEPGTIDQIQSEYMLPRPQAMTALAKLRTIGDRIDRLLHLTEIRSVAADPLWLSPCHGHDSIAIHFTWKKQPEAVYAITQDIEDMLLPLGARPHWGKLLHAQAARLAPLYPHLPAFRDLARSHDPQGKFRNEFLDVHVFG